MADVRRAGELLRNGHGHDAVRLLASSDRLRTAPSAGDLIADIVHDWHTDHRRHLTGGTAPSRMMAEHHTTRRLLNRASHAYYLQAISTKGKLDPLVKAKQAWAGNSFKRGPDCDLEDPYIARCWNTVDPFIDHHQEFISLAHRLWEPLLNALERG